MASRGKTSGERVASRATILDPKVKANLRRRIRDQAELKTAVLERCTIEFSERWPHDEPAQVKAIINTLDNFDKTTNQAAANLTRLRACLADCLEIQDELYFGAEADDEGRVPPNPVEELAEIGWALGQLEERWVKVRAEWERTWSGKAAKPNGLRDPAWRDWEEPRLCRRQLVYYQYSKATSPSGRPVTDRDLAVVSLLAGNREIEPGKRGATVSEVIVLEKRAMRKLRESDGGVALRGLDWDED